MRIPFRAVVLEVRTAYVTVAFLHFHLMGAGCIHLDFRFDPHPQKHDVAVGAANPLFKVFRFFRLTRHPVFQAMLAQFLAAGFFLFVALPLAVANNVLDAGIVDVAEVRADPRVVLFRYGDRVSIHLLAHILNSQRRQVRFLVATNAGPVVTAEPPHNERTFLAVPHRHRHHLPVDVPASHRGRGCRQTQPCNVRRLRRWTQLFQFFTLFHKPCHPYLSCTSCPAYTSCRQCE